MTNANGLLLLFLRSFSTCPRLLKEIPRKLKSKSSHEWMSRHINDRYVKEARYRNYRARSAFKLLEIDDRFRFIRPGHVVVECGAAPGAWTQVIVHRINSDGKDYTKPIGKVIALDLMSLAPLEGATMISNVDLTKLENHRRVVELLNGSRVDVVVSDMAPSVCGMHAIDHEKSVHLLYMALRLSLQILSGGGSFLGKLLEGGSGKAIEVDVLRYFDTLKLVKPAASRTESSEIFYLARGFKGTVSVKT